MIHMRMTTIVRKNLVCLLSNLNSFVCKSPVSHPLSLNYFSTWKDRHTVICPRVFDLLFHKHQFSLPVASLVASDLAQPKNPERFLKESGCLTSQLERIVVYSLGSVSDDELKLKIKIFQDLGFSPKEIAKTISYYPRFLHSHVDLEKSLLPNVEFLKSIGMSMEHILFLLYTFPKCLLSKPNIIRKSVDKAKEIGLSESSKMFVYALQNIAPISQRMWKVKMQFFRDLGFSDSDTLTVFRKAPQVLNKSKYKIEAVKELLLATGKFSISSIVTNPSSIGCSIEKRLKPRLQILGILESEKLIEKWPALGTICTMPDHKFYVKFIEPYPNEVAKYWPQRVESEANLKCDGHEQPGLYNSSASWS